MHLKNKPPAFVPEDHWAEFDKLSKATLMDMVWDYAQQICGGTPDPTEVMAEFRQRRKLILHYRKHGFSEAKRDD